MKKSIGICCFYGNWSIEEKFVLAKEAGFTGFEIDLSEDGPVNLKSTPEELKSFRSLAKKHGLAWTTFGHSTIRRRNMHFELSVNNNTSTMVANNIDN